MEVNPRFLRACEILLKIDPQRIAARASARGFNEKEVEELLNSIDKGEIQVIYRLRAWCDRYR